MVYEICNINKLNEWAEGFRLLCPLAKISTTSRAGSRGLRCRHELPAFVLYNNAAYFIITFMDLSPILTMAISPFLRLVAMEVEAPMDLAEPTIMPDVE